MGEGAYSTVYKILRKTDGKEYAIKSIKLANLSDKERENSINEIRFLASINSPYIISYKDAIFDDKLKTLHIIMEYAPGGDLY